MNNEERLEIAKRYIEDNVKNKEMLKGIYLIKNISSEYYKELTGRNSKKSICKVIKDLYSGDIRMKANHSVHYERDEWMRKNKVALTYYEKEIDTYIIYFYNVTLEEDAKFINAMIVYPNEQVDYYNTNSIEDFTVDNVTTSLDIRGGERSLYEFRPRSILIEDMWRCLIQREANKPSDTKNINKELEPLLKEYNLTNNGHVAIISKVKDNIICLRIFLYDQGCVRNYYEYVRIYFDKEKSYFYYRDDFDNFTDNEENIDKVKENIYDFMINKFDRCVNDKVIIEKDALNDTRFEYIKDIISELKRRLIDHSIVYVIYNFMTNEFAESLYKQGFKKLAIDYIYNSKMFGDLNKDGKTFYQKLGVNKNQWKIFIDAIKYSKENEYIEAIKYILNSSKIDILTDEQFEKIIMLLSKDHNLKFIFRTIKDIYSFEEMLLSVNNFSFLYTYEYLSYRERMLMDDYFDMVEKTNTQNIFKATFESLKDIRIKHDALVALYNEKKDELRSEAFNKRINDWKKFEYAGKDFAVVIPTTPDDLANEGVELHHCVKTYIERVAQGKTNIVFIRKKNEPDKPFFTVEVDNNDVIQQVHGFANRCANTETGMCQFVEEWAKKKKLNTSNFNKVR